MTERDIRNRLTRAAACVTAIVVVGLPARGSTPTNVSIPGDYQNNAGCAGNWDPACAATQLTYDANSDVWKGTFTISAAGSYNYKVAINNSWTENYGLNATPGGANIPLSLAAAGPVKFYYDHKTHWVADNQGYVIANVPGDFQQSLGCASNWDPTCFRSWLEDPSGSGTYSFSTTALPAGTYNAKVALNESWTVNYGAGGAPGGANISFTVPQNSCLVNFSYNPTTHILVIAASSTLAANSGSGQSAPVNTTFANPLVATLKDSRNNPIAGATVTFTGTGIAAATATTNALGVASATVTANGIGGGPYTVTASAGCGASATFTLTDLSGPATHYAVSAPANATAGSAFSFTVTAQDQFNNTATGYGGTVHFISSDAQSVLPADSTLTNGVGTFSATLKTAGNQTLTARDTVTASITGTSNTIAVSAAAATHFTVSAPANATAGSAFSFTVTAQDQFNNTETGYGGTVHFVSSDGAATLPTNSALINGTGTFSATLRTAGNQTLTGTDSVTASINGTSGAIAVALAATDVAITKTASAPPYGTGLSITYTIVVSDIGPASATAVTMTDTIPAGTTFVSATPTQGSCSGTTTVTCNIGTLASGGSATVSLVLTLPSTAGPVSNTATVSSASPDTNPANNSSTATVSVVSAAAIPAVPPLGLLLLVLTVAVIGVIRLRA